MRRSARFHKTSRSTTWVYLITLSFILGQLFTGWPQIFNFPPQLQTVRAAPVVGTPTTAVDDKVNSITIFNHAVSGSDVVLYVLISALAKSTGSGINEPESVTWNGSEGLTKVGFINTNKMATMIWVHTSPTPTTADIVISHSSSNNWSWSGVVAAAVTVTGVNTASPDDGYNAVSDTTSTATQDVSSATDDIVLDVISIDKKKGGTCTVGSGQTQKWNPTPTKDMYGCGSTEPGAGTVTMSWALGSSVNWSSSAISINPAVSTTYTPATRNWRWFDAEDVADPNTTTGGETTTGDAMDAEDTEPTNTRIIYKLNAMKLRIVVGETGGGTATDVKYKLQYDTATDFLSATDVAAIDSTGALWRYFNGANVNDDDPIATDGFRLSGMSNSNLGRHNEDSATGSGAGSTFDPAASTDYEHEFTIQNYNATANTVYYFRLQYMVDSTTTTTWTTVDLGATEAYPSVKASAAYDLETYQVPANVQLGSYTKGGDGTLNYPFVAGEEVVFWDKRGTGVGYSLTVSPLALVCGGCVPLDTITGSDITWTSATASLSVSFASDKAGITGNSGTLNVPRTAYSALFDADPTVNTGGFFFLPTIDLANLNSRDVGAYNGDLIITIA